MKTRIVVEVGSTHLGQASLVKEGIERSAEMGADVVKFQLFPNTEKYTKSGNVWMSHDLYLYALEIGRNNGIPVTASVFDEDSFEFLLKTDPVFIKFAFSQKENAVCIRETLRNKIEAIVSCDHMSRGSLPEMATTLFCVPQYPTYFDIRFEGVFPLFDGFSDHTMGVDQSVKAAIWGAKTIEKHMKISDSGCPDCAFALSPQDFAFMIKEIRRWEGERIQ